MKKICAVLLTLLLAACSAPTQSYEGESIVSSAGGTVSETVQTQSQESSLTEENQRWDDLSAWTVYWNHENSLDEVELLGSKLKNIIHFAAYFDEENQLFVPEDTTIFFQTVKQMYSEKRYTHYLSFVNDKLNQDAPSLLKDTKLLETLFKDENSMQNHIDDVLSAAEQGGYDGIEIDYEAIRKNTKLWKSFLIFIEKLYVQTQEKQLGLRVVLEPSAPIGQLDFPEGPEYVMMCYNLYGPGTTPGPKADKEFISELAKTMSLLPGEKSFAFATGGFDWAYKGDCVGITEQQAQARLTQYALTPERDEISAALTFDYHDEEGILHEVWYADGETLRIWMELSESVQTSAPSIWRLNGNQRESLIGFEG